MNDMIASLDETNQSTPRNGKSRPRMFRAPTGGSYPVTFAVFVLGAVPPFLESIANPYAAVVGGAIQPCFMGLPADHYSMGVAFIMPLICFTFIAFYGFSRRNWFAHDMDPEDEINLSQKLT